MALFRHSAKNFWIFFKKILCRVPRLGTRQRNYIYFFLKNLCRVPCPWHSAKTPRIAIFFTFHCNKQYIYIYTHTHQSSHLYHQHALYITSTRIFNKSIENPSQMHQSSTSQVYYYKFDITKFNISTAATETAGVAPWTAVKDRTAAKGWRDQPPVTR